MSNAIFCKKIILTHKLYYYYYNYY